MSKIALITTSTRTPRVGPSVTEVVKEIIEPSASGIELSVVDVADYKLPVFDEVALPAMVPAQGQFAHDHSKKWNAEIEKYDAYIIIANEYNFGMSGATKNAIDYLYHAWIGKPILIVTYGIAGGTTASEQLKSVLTGMKLRVAETRPALAFVGGPHGPDTYSAIGKGALGDASKESWKTEKKEDILKGFEELKEALKGPQVAAAPKE